MDDVGCGKFIYILWMENGLNCELWPVNCELSIEWIHTLLLPSICDTRKYILFLITIHSIILHYIQQYINPNYGGGGRDEYFNYASDDDAAYGYNYGYDTSSSGSGNSSGNNVNGLDCHSPNTEWELVGVYREEF